MRLSHRKAVIEALEPRVFLSADTVGNTIATAQTLSLSSSGAASTSSAIDYAGDKDFYSIAVAKAGMVSVSLAASSGSGLHPLLTAYSSSGLVIDQNASNVKFNVSASGTYYLRAASQDSSIGGYALSVSTSAVTTTSPPSFLPNESAYKAASTVSGRILTTSSGAVLLIQGTDNADTLTLSESGTKTINVVVTGLSRPLTFTSSTDFVGLAIYGFGGNDRIRETYSMAPNLKTVIYGGSGDDQIFDNGQAQAWIYGGAGNDKIVSIGTSTTNVCGGDGFDSFWVDSRDTIGDAESAETAGLNVHVVSAFEAPNNAASVLQINGQDLVDPTTTSPSIKYSSVYATRPLFSSIPLYDDIRQGGIGDCYFVASLSAIAQTDPNHITQAITDLGDGTYAVRFFDGSGNEKYYRIDGQLPVSGNTTAYAQLTKGGALWVPLLEKAFAQYRYLTQPGKAPNSYGSIELGSPSEGYRGLFNASTIGVWSNQPETLALTLSNYLAAGHAINADTGAVAASYLVPTHAYEVRAVERDPTTGKWYVTVRNPWGADGAASYKGDTKNDGLIRLALTDFLNNFSIDVASKA